MTLRNDQSNDCLGKINGPAEIPIDIGALRVLYERNLNISQRLSSSCPAIVPFQMIAGGR